MKPFDQNYKLLNEMYRDEYYPNFLGTRYEIGFREVIDLLESGETDIEVVQAQLDRVVCAINDLQGGIRRKRQ